MVEENGVVLDGASATRLWRDLLQGQLCVCGGGRGAGEYLYCVARVRHEAAYSKWVLSQREAEVLRCVAGGYSNKATAYELGVSVSTVATHWGAVTRKLSSDGPGQRLQLFAACLHFARASDCHD